MSTPLISHSSRVESPYIVKHNGVVGVVLPEKPLADQSLKLEALEKKSYMNWTEQESSSIYDFLQKIVAVWAKAKIANQYLVFGKQNLTENTFAWEAVPYYRASNAIARIWQQLTVFWRIIFKGITKTKQQKQKKLQEYQKRFDQQEITQAISLKPSEVISGSDAFCREDVINKQWVFLGNKVKVLYDYAPVSSGPEKLHLLIVPNLHKKKFTDVSREEYLESVKIAKKIIKYFASTTAMKSVYLFHKTGKDAGQGEPHWHMHLIFVKQYSFWEKLTVFIKIVIWSFPMNKSELATRVKNLRIQLQSL